MKNIHHSQKKTGRLSLSKISLGILCALGCIGAANAADHQLNEQRDLREALELSKQQALKEENDLNLAKALSLSEQESLRQPPSVK